MDTIDKMYLRVDDDYGNRLVCNIVTVDGQSYTLTSNNKNDEVPEFVYCLMSEVRKLYCSLPDDMYIDYERIVTSRL